MRHGPNMGDAPSVMGWDPRIERYVFGPRPGHRLALGIYGNGDHRHIRSYGYATSKDVIRWAPTKVMLTSNHADRVDYQYMQMTDGGINGKFDIGFNAVVETFKQTRDIFLMSSRDGCNWTWIDRELPVIGRGEVGTCDDDYTTPSGPIFHDGKVGIYYGAFSGAHSANRKNVVEMVMAIALCCYS